MDNQPVFACILLEFVLDSSHNRFDLLRENVKQRLGGDFDSSILLLQSLLLFDDLGNLCVVILKIGCGLPVVQVYQHVRQVAAKPILRFVQLLLRWLRLLGMRVF